MNDPDIASVSSQHEWIRRETSATVVPRIRTQIKWNNYETYPYRDDY